MISAALFDFGGVILSSPFDAFAAHEQAQGLPEGLIRKINSTDPDTNAWARLERNEVDLAGFSKLFEAEAAALGHEVSGAAVLACLEGDLRPAMVEAVRRCSTRMKTGLLTNNFVSMDTLGSGADTIRETARREVVDLFDIVVESSIVGVRKPDAAFYEVACEQLEITPDQAVFLDDLGVNLKPARAMGMTTIKVTDPRLAIAELEEVVGFPLG
jgi:putative hydrolase of the HAD superfamily